MPRLGAPMLSGGELSLDLHVDDVVEVVLGQRRRLANRLAALEAGDWSAASRCAQWNVADVVAHLTDASRWTVALLGGQPAWPGRFDPEVTPHEFVLTHRGRERSDLLRDLEEGTETLGAALRERTEPILWLGMAHYPPALAAAHLLWDSWLHERDVLVPLGREDRVDPDELEVAAGYGLLLASLRGLGRTAVVELERSDAAPLAFQIQPGNGVAVARVGAGPADVTGPAAAVVDALAGRGLPPEALTGCGETIAALGRMSAAWRSRAEPAAHESPD